MKNILLLNKKVGQTPLEAMKAFQKENPEYSEVKLTYAGRLDPMAEGLLIVVAGEEIKNKEKYLQLDKEYEFEVLFGVETDSYDVLGKIVNSSSFIVDSYEPLTMNYEQFTGSKLQSYPPYSSKTVDGKPLFEYAKENKLEEIEVPNRVVTIYSMKVLEEREIDAKSLKKYIFERVDLVSGDFRQDEILKSWENFFTEMIDHRFLVVRFSATVSSGTYIRSLAHEIGKKLGVGAIALNIKRTKVGEFSI